MEKRCLCFVVSVFGVSAAFEGWHRLAQAAQKSSQWRPVSLCLEKPMSAKTALLSLLFATAGAFAQDAVQTDGDKYKAIFENECVRVLDYKDQPGEATHQHRHPAFVLYALMPFKRSLALPDGKVLQRQFKEGDVMWSDAQTHIGTNTGDTPTHVLLIEMKSEIGACAGR